MSKRGRIDPVQHTEPASLAVTIEWIKEKEIEKERERCTVCGARHDWYQLEPGTGRCPKCQP